MYIFLLVRSITQRCIKIMKYKSRPNTSCKRKQDDSFTMYVGINILNLALHIHDKQYRQIIINIDGVRIL